jgi:type II secretory pathway pseudopilin PulG
MEKKTFRRGLTLVEVLVAAVIMFIVAIGGLMYQAYGAKHKRIAWAELTSLRTAQMVIEDWKSTGGAVLDGANGYTPEYFDQDFDHDHGETWTINIENLPMEVSLRSDDVEVNEDAGITLKKLEVLVKWNVDFSGGSVPAESPSMRLITYVRADASGG